MSCMLYVNETYDFYQMRNEKFMRESFFINIPQFQTMSPLLTIPFSKNLKQYLVTVIKFI